MNKTPVPSSDKPRIPNIPRGRQARRRMKKKLGAYRGKVWQMVCAIMKKKHPGAKPTEIRARAKAFISENEK